MNKQKSIVFALIIIFALAIVTNISNNNISENVRIRVVANSNSTTDQKIKYECVNIQDYLYKLTLVYNDSYQHFKFIIFFYQYIIIKI